jgi:hypothetical protein
MLVVSMVFMIGCMVHTHVVGDGGKGGPPEAGRQWYILWGLVPLNNISSKDMAKGASNYTIKTEYTPLDVIISLVTGIVTVNCRSVEVSK